MPIRKENLPPDITRAVPALNEAIEDLSHGVEDGRVRKVKDGNGISTRKLRFFETELTVGTTEAVIRHGLGVVPHFVTITMRSPGTVWQTRRSDGDRVWVIADAAGRTAHVVVFA